MTDYKAKKCYWTYDSMRQVAIAYAGLLVDNEKTTMENAKDNIIFFNTVMQICAGDKSTAKKLQTMGKNAEQGAAEQ